MLYLQLYAQATAGDPNARKLKRYQPIVSDINLLEDQISPLSDEELRAKTSNFQNLLADVQTRRSTWNSR